MTGITELMGHLAKASDWHIRHDLDPVLAACSDELTREAVRQYARLRRRAPGFNPTWRETRTRNSHEAIPAKAVEALIVAATPKPQRVCCACLERFTAKRSDARFCSPRCRQNARRLGFVVGRTVRGSDRCPHGSTLARCPERWCVGRLADLAEHPDSPALMAPEHVTDNSAFEAA